MSLPTSPQQFRRDQGPTTERGAQRREALLIAARRVFERQGFLDVGVADIVKEAGVARGTFYTYFDTKEAVFTEVARMAIDSMVESMVPPRSEKGFHERIPDSIRRFIHAYRPNATIIRLVEQVGTYSPDLRDLRLNLRETFVRRSHRGIVRMVEAGYASADLDAEYVAESLGSMLEYTCYVWFSLGREFDEDRLVATLASIWENALHSGT